MPPSALERALGLLRLSHPFPSVLNAVATGAIALLAGAEPPTAARLGAAMLCLQASIGAVNDLADVEVDRLGKPTKPLATGLVLPRTAKVWAAGAAVLGLVLAFPSGSAATLVAAAGLGLGYAYDLRLSRTALSWLPLALALPLLPVFAWLGASGDVPRDLLLLIPIAALAGAGLLIGNGLVDVERDARAGRSTLEVRLGRRGAWLVNVVVLSVAVALAFLLAPQLTGFGPPEEGGGALAWQVRSIGFPGGAFAIAIGAGLLNATRAGIRERGWELQAVGTALLGIGWLAGIALTEGTLVR
jgi:4-hydroxybenzoate polyprenyltransferase